jgi:hypothetical protein
MKFQFPKTIFVTRDGDAECHEDGYLLVSENSADAIDEAGNGNQVAIYTLDRVATAEIRKSFKGK